MTHLKKLISFFVSNILHFLISYSVFTHKNGYKNHGNCHVKTLKKYKTFSLAVKKENGHDKPITYKMKTIDSVRFKTISLSSLSNNIAEGLQKTKCKDFSFASSTWEPKMIC